MNIHRNVCRISGGNSRRVRPVAAVMRAIHARSAGGPEVMSTVTLDTPAPGPGQVVVDVEAAGVNFIDTYRRGGVYPMTFPHVVGTEGAGVVSAAGPDAAFAVGARVAWADGSSGSYAEQVVVDSASTVPVPDDVPLTTAAALLLQGLTAHYLADSTFPVSPGQVVLVHAGAGGVGLLLTQLAVARGARVITTVSTADKAELSHEAGASDVIRYDRMGDLTDELPRAVRALTDGAGVHTVFDGVGRATFDASLASLRRRGGLALFGGASGQVPPVDPQRLNRAGSVYLTRPNLGDYVAEREELLRRSAELFAAVRRGELRVRVGGTYPLAEAAHAHRDLEGRATTGKLLLVP